MNNRILRINEDIQRVLATLLQGVKDPRVKRQGMISVTAVDTSGDLSRAKVYLSVYKIDATASTDMTPPEQAAQSQKDFLKGLKSASGHLRYELGRVLSLRHTPELVFVLDESIKRGARISTILSDMDIPADSAGDTEAESE